MSILTDTKERGRFLRFAVVGAIGAVIDFGVFNIVISSTSLAAIFASAISFIAAVCSNFVWNRYFTYPDSRNKAIHHQIVQFLIISLIGLGIRLVLFALLEVRLIELFAFLLSTDTGAPLPMSLGHNTTLAFAIGVVMMWNFFANRYWTYSDVS